MGDQYSDIWDFKALSRNKALPWSEELIARYENKWDWEGEDEGEGLSQNEALPWSKELIVRYEDRWDWSRLPSDALTQYTPYDIR